MKRKPYIGITGFTSRKESTKTLDLYRELIKDLGENATNRKFMVGVLISSKTMDGIPNKWPNRYPTIDKLAKICVSDPLALNIIHFNTKRVEKLPDDMGRITEIGGPNLHGFQLNISWPNPELIRKYKNKFPEKKIILQIGNGAFEKVSHGPVKLAKKVEEYYGLADYVLMDPSGGLGLELDTDKILEYLVQLDKKVPDILCGIAGGLSGKTVKRLISPVIEKFDSVSIDAEGKLRDDNDCLSIQKATDYLTGCLELF